MSDLKEKIVDIMFEDVAFKDGCYRCVDSVLQAVYEDLKKEKYGNSSCSDYLYLDEWAKEQKLDIKDD